MKYYLYISDAKIDMLYPQVPHPVKEKVATQFGFDLKFLSASRRTEADREENRISRLEVVTQFIRDFCKLGTLDQPDDYIEDAMSMRTTCVPDNNPLFVYFGGNINKTYVGLWGSLKHVIGNSGVDHSLTVSSSLARDALWYLITGLEDDFTPTSPSDSARLEAYERRMDIFRGMRINAFAAPPESWGGLIMIANSDMNSHPEQRVEFMAKRLLEQHDSEAGYRFLLATPLYIALTDS